MPATSWHILLVMASRSPDAHAGSSSQRRGADCDRPASTGSGSSCVVLIRSQQATAFDRRWTDVMRSVIGYCCDRGRSHSDDDATSLDRPVSSRPASPLSPALNIFNAQNPQQSTYATKPHPQKPAWIFRVKCVSKKNG